MFATVLYFVSSPQVLSYAMFSLLERAALDTSASFSRGDGDCSGTGKTAIVCEELAIATQTGITSVEDRGLVYVICMCEPVPVLGKLDM